MKKILLSFLFLLFSIVGFSQTEKYPVFTACELEPVSNLPSCFKNQVKEAVLKDFKIPENVIQENFKGSINVVFLVDVSGNFKVLYVNSPYKELKAEVERVFKKFPIITPAKFNNHNIEMQFVFPIAIPLENNEQFQEMVLQEAKEIEKFATIKKEEKLLISSEKSLFPEHKSALNIPYTIAEYNIFDYYLNKAENSHTSMKPYVYTEVDKYLNLDIQKSTLLKPKTTWFGRKLLNEHMANVKGKDFWFTVDPIVDLQVGRDSDDINTFNNTRGVQINGGLGKNLNFSTSFYESQGRFANYFNEFAESIKPDGGNPAIIPGRGIAKRFKTDAYDYPVAEAYLSYTPSKHFNFQFGNGKNFIGDGYRSLFLSDVASPYPYFKINTSFWKIKYTNLFMSMQDVRPELTVDGAYKKKFVAIHYLSWNVSKKINLGFFETVIWDNSNDRGFDVNYLNPLIFYTAAEFGSGSRAGNTLLGLSLKYKHKNIALYSQLLIDEFRLSEITSSDGWWGNKNGIQIGAKFYNAFKIENLFLQIEHNAVKPYTYSHDELNYNFGHNNQPLAHLWGSNFNETIFIARYTKDRWFANSKIVIGKKGFDYNTTADNFSYGGDIYRDNDERFSEYGNKIGQGNEASIAIADLQVGYLVNAATNLKLFGGITFRNFEPVNPSTTFNKSNTTWISFGLKTDVFNWYFDF
ncbi:hypothetical protein BX611_2511 [Lutibacter oceani]|uniref:Protein involved in gliding motility RemB n=1 Tax=Lutibacter oceani TaxID=1853311 RepID=A0A3D9RLT3_9FLAO|nr:gliding motility protein RemB [Lutibacter oceani]REE80853.1 hypothetical protein BX611_2511 [Lutibacter oceani]